MKKLAIPTLAFLLLVPLGRAAEKPGDTPAKAVAAGNTAFATELYAALRDRPGNLFFSPWSVTTALAMVRQGAKGKTASEMDAVLHFPAEKTAKGVHDLTAALAPGTIFRDKKKIPAYETSIANRVWVQDGLELVPAFTKVLTDSFDAPPGRIDFKETAKARAAINDWVSEHTRKRILDIVPKGLPSKDTLLALANAIYYKAAWAHPFVKFATKDAPFQTSSGSDVTCHMMLHSGFYGYADTKDVAILEMPYRGHETSMVILLPKAKDGLPALEKKLDAGTLPKWLDSLSGRRVTVRLPRFEFTSDFDLSSVLQGMGMKAAFDPAAADFSGITIAEPLFIGPVLHKAFVAVDEAGTEAAAATVVFMPRGAAPGRAVEFTADHPFLFLIRHRATGTVLFMGRVEDPTRQ